MGFPFPPPSRPLFLPLLFENHQSQFSNFLFPNRHHRLGSLSFYSVDNNNGEAESNSSLGLVNGSKKRGNVIVHGCHLCCHMLISRNHPCQKPCAQIDLATQKPSTPISHLCSNPPSNLRTHPSLFWPHFESDDLSPLEYLLFPQQLSKNWKSQGLKFWGVLVRWRSWTHSRRRKQVNQSGADLPTKPLKVIQWVRLFGEDRNGYMGQRGWKMVLRAWKNW